MNWLISMDASNMKFIVCIYPDKRKCFKKCDFDSFLNGSFCVLFKWMVSFYVTFHQSIRLSICLSTHLPAHSLLQININCLINSLSPGTFGSNSKFIIFKLILNSSLGTPVKLVSGKCHRTSVMRNQHWYWLGAIRQQAITCAIVDADLCHHISLGHNELMSVRLWFLYI